jgi:hypothetical protein
MKLNYKKFKQKTEEEKIRDEHKLGILKGNS